MATTRGTYRRSEETRATIVAAAREVLRERGFYGMSIAEVAKRSDMTRAGLMYHFPSREHVLLGVMQDRFNENRVWFDEQMVERGRNVLDVFIDLARRISEEPQTAMLLMVLAGASIDPANPAHTWYHDRYAYTRRMTASHLEAGQRRREIRGDINVETVAIQLLTILEGSIIQWLDNPDAVDLVEVMTEFCDLLRIR